MSVTLLSSEVSAGQPTAVDHYNHLRDDALFFSNDDTTAVPIADLFERYENNLNLVALSTNRVRVEASPTIPVDLVVSGRPVRAIANVDLSTGYAPSGAAATYYVFAVASGATFTLNISTSSTEWSGARRIGSFYWDGSAIVANSIATELRSYLVDLLKYAPPQSCQGRLTLTSETPVTTADVTGSTIYFTQYHGSTVDLYAPGFGWVPYTFDELTISAASLSSGLNYDVFIYLSSGTLTLELVQWSTATTRATALVYVDGIPVKYGETHKRYLGSVRTSAAGVVSDSASFRGVWNAYNQVVRPVSKTDTTTHTYASTTTRYWNNDSSQLITVLSGLTSPIYFNLTSLCRAGVTGYYAYVRLYDDNGSALLAKVGNNDDAVFHHDSRAIFTNLLGSNTYSIREAAASGATSTFQEYELTGFILG